MLYGPISNGGGRERGDVAIRYRIILRVVFKHATVFRSGAKRTSKIRKKHDQYGVYLGSFAENLIRFLYLGHSGN